MAIKLTSILIFYFIINLAFSQLEVIEINLDKEKSEIEVFSDSVFYIENKTIIRVKYSGDGRISYVKNSEGKIKNIGRGYYEVSFPDSTLAKATLLKFYETTPRNKSKLLLVKPYTLKRIPPPLITIGGVRNDSAINVEHLIRDNTVRSFDTVNNQLLMTHSFTINFPGQDSIRVKGNKIPMNIKAKLYNLKEGETLTLSNIHTILPDKRVYVTKNTLVFLILTDQYSVGNRRFIKP